MQTNRIPEFKIPGSTQTAHTLDDIKTHTFLSSLNLSLASNKNLTPLLLPVT